MNTKKGIVIHDMDNGISISCAWINNWQPMIIKNADINTCLLNFIRNARLAKRISENPYAKHEVPQ